MAVWTILWVSGTAGTAALFPDDVVEGQALTNVAILVWFITFGSLLSILAGFLTARLAPSKPMRLVWILALIQLALGLYFEISYWELMPVWYHLVFLALIVPTTLLGGRLFARS
ncbi:MAG: hypothetical protein DHS20C11_21050 [Lysobacteraceae bacterium]|nr:MAG: hypothetical protein DHS20C11_21050 [Xanthomonadaceae bacterium]